MERAVTKPISLAQFKRLHMGGKGLAGRQQMVSLVARRFNIRRTLVLGATTESLIAAWGRGDPQLLCRRDGTTLLEPARDALILKRICRRLRGVRHMSIMEEMRAMDAVILLLRRAGYGVDEFGEESRE
jgi:hypothetical protein